MERRWIKTPRNWCTSRTMGLFVLGTGDRGGCVPSCRGQIRFPYAKPCHVTITNETGLCDIYCGPNKSDALG